MASKFTKKKRRESRKRRRKHAIEGRLSFERDVSDGFALMCFKDTDRGEMMRHIIKLGGKINRQSNREKVSAKLEKILASSIDTIQRFYAVAGKK